MIKRSPNPVKLAKYLAELNLPPFPIELMYLWVWYLRLRRQAAFGNSILPINWTDIASFAALNHIEFVGWELNLIEALDTIYISEMAVKAE